MSKTHKFQVILGDCYWLMDDIRDEEIRSKILDNEEPRSKFIVCHHEEVMDNVVQIQGIEYEWELIRDVNGRLYYYEEILTKTDVVNGFE